MCLSLIEGIKKLRASKIPPPLPTMTFTEAPKFNENKKTFSNIEKLSHLLKPFSENERLSLRNEELKREIQRLRDYIHEHSIANITNQPIKLKPLDDKAIAHLKAKEDEPTAIWRGTVDEERKTFRKAHHNMSYDEYKEATKDSR